jgi:hypothetical protein
MEHTAREGVWKLSVIDGATTHVAYLRREAGGSFWGGGDRDDPTVAADAVVFGADYPWFPASGDWGLGDEWEGEGDGEGGGGSPPATAPAIPAAATPSGVTFSEAPATWPADIHTSIHWSFQPAVLQGAIGRSYNANFNGEEWRFGFSAQMYIDSIFKTIVDGLILAFCFLRAWQLPLREIQRR